jgi:nicotinate-nucleotide adenylyltransferase
MPATTPSTQPPDRLGIFGGTFDPIHFGHLLLAEYCREVCRLDQLWFMPAIVAPHKQHREATPAATRIEMLQLAIAGHPQFHVSDLEIRRGGVSYTVDTLEALHQEFPRTQLFFLMGADSLEDFPTWRQPDRICELAIPVCVRRFGSAEPDFARLAPWTSSARLAEIQNYAVAMPRIELSSTELRQRCAAGQSIRFQTPRAVEEFIRHHHVYQ